MNRSDTERLDWLMRRANSLFCYQQRNEWALAEPSPHGCEGEPKDGIHYDSPRQAIDAAMDAAEKVELDEAWKALREDDDAQIEFICVPDKEFDAGPEYWQAIINGHEASGAKRDDAILAAYRASKGAKP